MALRQGSGVPQCNIVTRMPLSKIALLCKQTNDNFRTAHGAIYRLIDYLFLIMINKSLTPSGDNLHVERYHCIYNTYYVTTSN